MSRCRELRARVSEGHGGGRQGISPYDAIAAVFYDAAVLSLNSSNTIVNLSPHMTVQIVPPCNAVGLLTSCPGRPPGGGVTRPQWSDGDPHAGRDVNATFSSPSSV